MVWVERDLQCYLVQLPCTEQEYLNQIRLLRVPSNLISNAARNGASTTSGSGQPVPEFALGPASLESVLLD